VKTNRPEPIVSFFNRRRNLDNWLIRFQLYPYTQVHASGLLNCDEIRDVCETVRPRTRIPVHAQHPAVFKNFHDNVIAPEKGRQIGL